MGAHGEGVAQNYKEAMRWFIKAAEKGHAKARFNIGNMHARGHGLREDRMSLACVPYKGRSREPCMRPHATTLGKIHAILGKIHEHKALP